MRRLGLSRKKLETPWCIKNVRRCALLEDVIEEFKQVTPKKRELLFRNTVVTFQDELGEEGEEEEGEDLGGLTAEMYSLFWKEALTPGAGLFSLAGETSASAGGGLLLPDADAPPESLVAVGAVLAKCVIDDHPVGRGLCRFVFDYLVSGDECASLMHTAAALAALADADAALADAWRSLLDDPTQLDGAGLTLADFDEDVDEDEAGIAITASNLRAAVLAGCRHRLLGPRRQSYDSLRHGFTRCEDLSVQLGAIDLADLSCLLQGKEAVSTDELLDCFVLPRYASEAEAFEAGFDDVGSSADLYFEDVLRDEAAFGEARRSALLKWCTALGALPVGGLREHRIKLRLYGPEVDDLSLPETHTCTRELHLPNYSSAAVLREKLLLALDHVADGFQKS